jgi:predicted nucleotide-binding protein with TIR-like domain
MLDWKPKVFIGSSVEGKRIADLIHVQLSHVAYPTVWSHMVFTSSGYPIDSLLKVVRNHDVAVMVLSPDDVSTMRGTTSTVPRSNVVFEAGLFMGRLGRDRCFLVHPRRHPNYTLPTDFLGLTPATYDEEHYRRDPAPALGSACTEILDAITKSDSLNRAVSISPTLQVEDQATSKLTYPKKLNLQVQNRTVSSVLVTSKDFELRGTLNGDPARRSGAKDFFRVDFLLQKVAGGADFYGEEVLLKPGGVARAWLALDKGTKDSDAHEALKNGTIGIWRFGCHWLSEPLEYREHEFRV